jgi:hypothetical protein
MELGRHETICAVAFGEEALCLKLDQQSLNRHEWNDSLKVAGVWLGGRGFFYGLSNFSLSSMSLCDDSKMTA